MKKDESQHPKLERTDKRMVKTIVEREEKRRRIGDAIEDNKPDASTDSKSEAPKVIDQSLGSEQGQATSGTIHTQAQAPVAGILKQDNTEETCESPNEKVRFEDVQMDVDSGQAKITDDRMLCQVEMVLNSAESEDIEKLLQAFRG